MVAFWQVPVRGMACPLQLCRGIAAASCAIVALWFVCGAGAAPLHSCPRAASRAAAAARACRAVSALRGGPLLLWTRCCHRSRCWTGRPGVYLPVGVSGGQGCHLWAGLPLCHARRAVHCACARGVYLGAPTATACQCPHACAAPPGTPFSRHLHGCRIMIQGGPRGAATAVL